MKINFSSFRIAYQSINYCLFVQLLRNLNVNKEKYEPEKHEKMQKNKTCYRLKQSGPRRRRLWAKGGVLWQQGCKQNTAWLPMNKQTRRGLQRLTLSHLYQLHATTVMIRHSFLWQTKRKTYMCTDKFVCSILQILF